MQKVLFFPLKVRIRKGIGDVRRVRELWARLQLHAPFAAAAAEARALADSPARAAASPAELRQLWDQVRKRNLSNVRGTEACNAARCIAVCTLCVCDVHTRVALTPRVLHDFL